MAHITALAVDRSGDLLIGQAKGAVRMVAVNGTVSTIAGTGSLTMTNGAATFPPDGTKAADVGLSEVSSLAVDAQGRIYVGDSQSGVIMRIDADGTVSFVAGDQAGAAEPTVTGSPTNQTRFADADGLGVRQKWRAAGGGGRTDRENRRRRRELSLPQETQRMREPTTVAPVSLTFSTY